MLIDELTNDTVAALEEFCEEEMCPKAVVLLRYFLGDEGREWLQDGVETIEHQRNLDGATEVFTDLQKQAGIPYQSEKLSRFLARELLETLKDFGN
jgi:hypothetical protein